MSKRLDLAGERYGILTAIKYVRSNPKNNMSYWLCQCDCGNTKEVSLGNLRFGHTKSCGCQKAKRGKDHSSFIHGMRNTKPFKSWCKIKERCFNKNDASYHDYGARGITIEEDLRDDFLAFYEEVGDPPENTSDWSIDRIDNNRGYERGNMRWANSKQQARNKLMSNANTTGVTGVQWYYQTWLTKKGVLNSCLYAVATWHTGDGKPKNRKFNVNKLGLLPAFAMACKYRNDKISELNALGYGYSDNHGTVRLKGQA
jgi:hypothetical protein